METTDELAGKAAGIMKERATFITDLWDLTSYFFVAPTQYDEKQAKKYWKGENPTRLREVREVLASIDDFSLENTEAVVGAWIQEKGYGMGQIMNTLRLALVGAGKGPGMYDVTAFIAEVAHRILVAEYNIVYLSIAVGRLHRHDRRTDVADLHLATVVVAERVNNDRLALGRSTPNMLQNLHYSTALRFSNR